MDEDKIRDAFEKEGISGEITCPKAFGMSAKYHIPKLEIAEYCNQNGIKIRGCQLGCFR